MFVAFLYSLSIYAVISHGLTNILLLVLGHGLLLLLIVAPIVCNSVCKGRDKVLFVFSNLVFIINVYLSIPLSVMG